MPTAARPQADVTRYRVLKPFQDRQRGDVLEASALPLSKRLQLCDQRWIEPLPEAQTDTEARPKTTRAKKQAA
jgi:hypothetical protein